MKLATVCFWGKSPYETAPHWHDMATYSLDVALEVIQDRNIFRDLDTDNLVVIDNETGEIIAENRKGE